MQQCYLTLHVAERAVLSSLKLMSWKISLRRLRFVPSRFIESTNESLYGKININASACGHNQLFVYRDRVEGCVNRIGKKGTMLMRFTLGVNTRKRVCRQAFRMAHRITRDYLNTVCRDVRMKKFGVLPAFSDRSNPALNQDPQFQEFCIKMNEKLGIELSGDQKAALKIGNSVEAGNCWAWMKYYFELVGDFEPNTNGEIHLEPGTVADIWEVYKSDQVASGEQKFLDYQQFGNIWETCFE